MSFLGGGGGGGVIKVNKVNGYTDRESNSVFFLFSFLPPVSLGVKS